MKTNKEIFEETKQTLQKIDKKLQLHLKANKNHEQLIKIYSKLVSLNHDKEELRREYLKNEVANKDNYWYHQWEANTLNDALLNLSKRFPNEALSANLKSIPKTRLEKFKSELEYKQNQDKE